MTSKHAAKLKILISILVSGTYLFGISHHAFNFWGLGILTELLVVLAIPVFALPIHWLLNRVWDASATIKKKRWALFLLPAFIISAIFVWRYYSPPSVWHTIEIVPAAGSGQVELYEIKYPPGRVVKFSKMEIPKGWKVEDNVLKTDGSNPAPLEYAFFSAIGEPTTLLFRGSPDGGKATIILDGNELEANLNSADASQIPLEMVTAYKLGIPGGIVLTLVAAIDFLFFFFLIAFIWMIQEIPQTARIKKRQEQSGSFPSHRAGISILLGAAALLHLLNALSVQLILGSDSPSFLIGAAHWMRYGNLDGVPAARGPMMTFFFIPAFLFFSRNPWGIKITMHLLAAACVPAAYALGWQIFKRRSFAFAAGAAAVLMPELYLYSNIIMSDAPNILLTVIFCAALVPALETFSVQSVIAAMFAGTLATLHRSENALLLVIAAGFLLLKIVWEREFAFSRLKIFAVAVLLASLPLLAWSAHNKRVHGFFGLSNYAGAIWYDGWIYYGEASKFPVTDHNAPSVRAIQQAAAAYDQPIEYVAAPTSLELYPAMRAYGYSDKQAMQLFSDAAFESMRANPYLTLELYFLKLRKSFEPEYNDLIATTYPKSGKAKTNREPEFDYFDDERVLFPALLPWQIRAYDWLREFNQGYGPFIVCCLVVCVFAVYQKNFFLWMPLAAITLSRLFAGVTMGLGSWRYMLSGVFLLTLFALLAIQIVGNFLSFIKSPNDFRNP